MKSNQKGSSVLVILTIMSILLMAGLATYKSATFFEQFALLRIAHEQQAVAVRSLLEYGVLTVARNYQTISEYQDPWSLSLESSDFRGIIKISKVDHAISVSATITEPQISTCTLTCLVIRKSDGKIQVRGFQRV